MKTVFSNTRIAAVALVLSLTLVFTSAANANETNPSGLELKFIGNLKNQPVFHLSYNGTVENEYTIVVRDEFNNVLYKDHVKGTNISKKFMLNTEELGDVDVTFEITDKKAGKPVVYSVSKNSRTIQDVVVNKIK